MNERVYNFSAGPATLPLPVLERVQSELLNWQGNGASVMEVSHRTPVIENLVLSAQDKFRKLYAIPDDYTILFLTGSTRSQFAMLVLNLLGEHDTVNYANTGFWSGLAMREAKHYTNVREVCSGESNGFKTIADVNTWDIDPNGAFLHYTSNETIHGVQFLTIPDVPSDMPLVVDATSDIFSKPLDISRLGFMYAGAQKNLGISGLTVGIIRNDLLARSHSKIPTVFNYQLQAKHHSMVCTPATFAIYVFDCMLDWVESQGGLNAVAKRNQRKAKKLYDFIDENDFYANTVDKQYRSTMNIVFSLADETLNDRFIQQASEHQLMQIKGHRVVGGMRASLYNAMPEAGVDALIAYMQGFLRHV